VTFSSIPATYRDLIIVINPISATTSATEVLTRINSDTGSNYPYVRMKGNGSVASSSSGTFTKVPQAVAVASNATSRNQSIIQIMDYAQTDKHKSILTRYDWGPEETETYATRWANTNAITTLSFTGDSQNLGTGTTIALYGIIS
jgi:hypothetical protein